MHFQQEPVELTYTYNGKISNLKLFNKILYARQRYFFPLGCKILLEVLKNWLRYRCWHGGNLCRFEPYKVVRIINDCLKNLSSINNFTLPVLSNICISYVRIINNIRVSPKEYYMLHTTLLFTFIP